MYNVMRRLRSDWLKRITVRKEPVSKEALANGTDKVGCGMENVKRHWYRNLSFTVKLLLFFALASILPVIIVGTVSVNIMSSNMTDQSVKDSLARLSFVEYRIKEEMKTKHRDMILTAYDNDVRAYSEADETYSAEELSLLEDKTKRLIMSFYNNIEATSILLVCENGNALSYSSYSYSAIRKVDASEYGPLDSSEFDLFDRWDDAAFDMGEAVIPYERIILGLKDDRPVAKLIANIKESVFHSLYASYEIENISTIYLVNERGVIQSCTDKSLISRRFSDVFEIGMEKLSGAEGYLISGNNLLVYRYDAQRKHYFIELTSTEKLHAGYSSIVRFTLLIALLCVTGCVLMGTLLSISLTKPLRSLIDRIGKDEIVSSPAKPARNEIAVLSDQYARMLSRLEHTIAEYTLEQQKKKEAQIRALEFQINPHFLYNTLSTIIWLIEAGESRAAIQITKDLSVFFRISVSKGREYITIREEITHVQLYVQIQKARYANRISLIVDVPEDIMRQYTPKLILQPLIENSIIHTIKTHSDRECIISVKAFYRGDDVIIEVRDNGTTIVQETLDKMNRFLYQRDSVEKTEEFGIGISNVHDRIQMSFGPEYGLRFRRENNETVAEVKIKTMLEEKPNG